MKGIKFVKVASGNKKAVLIDPAELGETWEDIYDVLVTLSRENESTIPWEDLKAEMVKE